MGSTSAVGFPDIPGIGGSTSLPQLTLGVRRTAGLDLILVMIVRHLSIFGNVNGGLGWPSCSTFRVVAKETCTQNTAGNLDC